MTDPLSADVLNGITSSVIAAAIRVHRVLGPGLLEHAYLTCLVYDLRSSGVRLEVQKPVSLIYRGVRLDCAYRTDLVVEESVIVEVKALDQIAAIHVRQLHTYVRLTGCRVGLLLNFGAMTMRNGIRRVVNGFPDREIVE